MPKKQRRTRSELINMKSEFDRKFNKGSEHIKLIKGSGEKEFKLKKEQREPNWNEKK